MPTDYVLFVHGVNTRNRAAFEASAQSMAQRLRQARPELTIKPILPYWGDLSDAALKPLRRDFAADPGWSKMWFRNFRSGEVLNFVGDAALYISRFMGARVVEAIYQQALATLQGAQEGDRLHLVTHSWGTVILFDILFAGRWDSETFARYYPEVHRNVMAIRNTLFGLGSDRLVGLRLAGIHTMGSPLALFNLINVNGASGHDLAPELKGMLTALQRQTGQPLCWRNFIHPGDPFAYPLTGLSQSLFDEAIAAVDLEDRFVRSWKPLDRLVGLLPQTLVPILNGGTAHGCYWDVSEVTRVIAKCL